MNDEKQAVQAMSAEQAADLEALKAATTEQNGAIAAEVPQEIAPDLAGELTTLVLAFVAMASPILPSLGRIYTPETTATAAAAVAAVCDKHGWAQGGFMGEWGVEIGAAVVLFPLAIATAQGVKADIAENERRQKESDAKSRTGVIEPPTAKADEPRNAAGTAIFGEVLPSANA